MKRFKKYLEERSLGSIAAAAAIGGAAMAAPPAAEMPQLDRIARGLISAEHRGFVGQDPGAYDPNLYIRNKVSTKSTAYGPLQLSRTTVADLSYRHPKIFSGYEDYTKKFIEQGQKMGKASAEDPTYGLGAPGDLSAEKLHSQYMDMGKAAISAMAKDIGVNLSKPLTPKEEMRLVTRFRGRPLETEYKSAYQKGVASVKPKAEEPKVETPATTTTDYTVKSGDTLGGIAKQQGRSIEDILKANPEIKDPNKIKPGQRIR